MIYGIYDIENIVEDGKIEFTIYFHTNVVHNDNYNCLLLHFSVY